MSFSSGSLGICIMARIFSFSLAWGPVAPKKSGSMDAASIASRMFHVVVVVIVDDIDMSPLPIDPEGMGGHVVILDDFEDEVEGRPETLLLSDEKMSSNPPSSSIGSDSGAALAALPLDPSVNATSGKKLSFPPPPLVIESV